LAGEIHQLMQQTLEQSQEAQIIKIK